MNKKRIILIVDDIPKNIQLVAQHLKPLNYKLLFATSGSKALKLLEENPVDLILMDIMMPEMNGFETCRIIKGKSQYSRLPIIFLTARNEVSDIVEGFDAGGSDYITKPFHGQELIERVKTHLELKIHRDQLQGRQRQLQELLHILSHDLRNSLSGITMTMDLADMEKRPLNNYELRLRDLSQNGLSIIDLVRTMLSLNEKPLELKPTNLNESLNQSLTILKPFIDSKKIRVKIHHTSDLQVMAEPTSLVNSVLNNILTNACKFTEEKGELIITMEEKNQNTVLTLRDFGVGIPEEIQSYLFDIHRATSRPGTNGEKGTGYGLPLARKFMNAYGGTIHIRSKTAGTPDFPRGTEISLSFPEIEI